MNFFLTLHTPPITLGEMSWHDSGSRGSRTIRLLTVLMLILAKLTQGNGSGNCCWNSKLKLGIVICLAVMV